MDVAPSEANVEVFAPSFDQASTVKIRSVLSKLILTRVRQNLGKHYVSQAFNNRKYE
jgi:hypothetical protein